MRILVFEQEKHKNLINWIKEKHTSTIYEALSTKQKEVSDFNKILSTELSKEEYIKSNQNILLLEKEEEVIGYLWYEIIKSNFTDSTISYILDIYIVESERHKGYSSLLIKDLKERMLNLGIHRIDLSVSSNNMAIKLYENEGFEKTMIRMSCILSK